MIELTGIIKTKNIEEEENTNHNYRKKSVKAWNGEIPEAYLKKFRWAKILEAYINYLENKIKRLKKQKIRQKAIDKLEYSKLFNRIVRREFKLQVELERLLRNFGIKNPKDHAKLFIEERLKK